MSSCQSQPNNDLCPAVSFGSYDACSQCTSGTDKQARWNSQDTDACSMSPTIFYPESRCDYRERASRNIYDWKPAFDYGTNASACSYIGVTEPMGATFTYGTPSAMFRTNRGISYGSYVGALDRDRLTPYYDDKGPGACAGPEVCSNQGSSNAREYNFATTNIPYTPYSTN